MGIALPLQKHSVAFLGLTVGAIYTALYGLFLVYSDGFPYVFDNNESFSSLWHASNLFHFGFENSFGLADEAFSPFPEAHPYLHTHQGNFPRLFAYVLYILGCRSIESQIVVTTFTVGLASTLMGFAVITRIAGQAFAFIACLVLMSDYILVSQWQVVTYRVWHGFFVFSSLLCIYAARERVRGWSALVFLNFLCLYYFELVFVALVSLSTAFYAAYVLRDERRVLWKFFLFLGAGAATSLAILLWQLTMQFGWEIVLKDLKLTFLARNEYLGSAELRAAIDSFYQTNRIVFWLNLEDGSRFRTLGHFIASLTYYEFQAHTPFFTTLTWILGGGGLMLAAQGTARRGVFGPRWNAVEGFVTSPHVVVPTALVLIFLVHRTLRAGISYGDGLAMLLIFVLASVGTHHLARKYTVADHRESELKASCFGFGLIVALTPFLVRQFTGNSAIEYAGPQFVLYCFALFAALLWTGYGVARACGSSSGRAISMMPAAAFGLVLSGLIVVTLGGEWMFGMETVGVLSEPRNLAIITALCVVISVSFFWTSVATLTGDAQSRIAALGRATVFLGAAWLLMLASARLYNGSYHLVWEELTSAVLPGVAKFALLYVVIGVLVVALASGTAAFGSFRIRSRIGNLLVLGGCALVSYGIVYCLSPGYVFTGYRFRFVPFTVFYFDLIIAFAFYTLYILWRKGPLKVQPDARIPIEASKVSMVRVLALTSLLLLGWFWVGMQGRYVQLLPADNYHFLRKLAQPPYYQKTFIVNNYAAPIAAYTENWAYLHGALTGRILPQREGVVVIELDRSYLWFADKDTNESYRTPDYFLCAAAPSMATLIDYLGHRSGGSTSSRGCQDHPIVKIAAGRTNQKVTPKLNLLEMDERGLASKGFARWAIIELQRE